MNSEAGASGSNKKSFFKKDDYMAFRIALDVEESDLEEFCKNVNSQKLETPDWLKKSIFKERNTSKKKDFGETKKRINFQIRNEDVGKENKYPGEKAEKSMGAVKKVIVEKKKLDKKKTLRKRKKDNDENEIENEEKIVEDGMLK